jgi:hypothetical protein
MVVMFSGLPGARHRLSKPEGGGVTDGIEVLAGLVLGPLALMAGGLGSAIFSGVLVILLIPVIYPICWLADLWRERKRRTK